MTAGRMITMLSDAESVLDVAQAALSASDPPDMWIQMSTIGVDGGERCAEPADDHDIAYVDAPVLGTRAPAEQGKLVILASGPDFDAIEGGPLDLPYARLKGPAMVKRAFDDVSFHLALSRKDADLVLAAAAKGGLELPVMAGVAARLRAAEAQGHGDKDMAATYLAHPPTAPADVKPAQAR